MDGVARRWQRRRLMPIAGAALVCAFAVHAGVAPSGVGASLVAPPDTPVATPDDPLPIELSPRSGEPDDRLVFAHYFTPFPISIDNLDASEDSFTTDFLDPAGENGSHAEYGGLIRHRPLPRDPIDAPDWQLRDMRTEIERARAAGIDGFTVDLLSLDGYHWDRVQTLVAAANEVAPDFRLMLMPDATTGTVSDPAELAAAVASLADEPSVYHLADGRLVISPFATERQPVAWWTDWIDLMSSQYGIEIAFVPLLNDFWSHVDEFEPISYGLSMGARGSPATNGNIALPIERAATAGKAWMQPISVQDSRPRRGIYDESNNSENLRLTWQAAIDGGVPWVHLFSWNDYAEHTVFAPSTDTGWSALDISAYYVEWFRTGVEPTIARDALYVSHRIQPADAVPTGGQTKLMEVRASSDAPRDTVEVLSMLTAPVDVTVTVGATTTTYTAPAGVHAELFPLELGGVSARFAYPSGVSVDVISPYEVTGAPVVQNLLYHYVSSAREGVISGLVPATSSTVSSPDASMVPGAASSGSEGTADVAQGTGPSVADPRTDASTDASTDTGGPVNATVVVGLIAGATVALGSATLARRRRRTISSD